jgi:FixJ family two-component response regulator
MQKEGGMLKRSDEIFLNNKKIFIVDDDESVCRSLKLLMGTYGFAAETFPCAEKFFNAVPNSVPGCLILDIHMPGLNGWEAQKKLKASGSNRPVIIITADKNTDLKDQALKTGAVGFLQKPFNDNELIDLVNLTF